MERTKVSTKYRQSKLAKESFSEGGTHVTWPAYGALMEESTAGSIEK